MSEIKPVYQQRRDFDEWEDIPKDTYDMRVNGKYQVRILYPAADYEALQKENDRLTKCLIGANANHEQFERQYYLELNKVEDLTAESAAQAKRIAELEEDLQFVERWANHHGTKPSVTAQEALSCIQHYPSIAAITKSYKDGVIPTTRNPYAEIEAQAKRIEQQDEIIKATLEVIEATADFARDFYKQADKKSETRVAVPTFKELERRLRTYLPTSKNGE